MSDEIDWQQEFFKYATGRGNHRPDNRMRRKREFLWYIKQVRNCYRCGQLMKDFDDTTVEHIVPKCQGGKNLISNLSLSHMQCNTQHGGALGIEKGVRMFPSFLPWEAT